MSASYSRPIAITVLAASLTTACGSGNVRPSTEPHLRAESTPALDVAAIPQPVQTALALPRPKAAAKTETYSVVVSNVKAQDLLFALARDAKLNVDIHPGISGVVTLNAIDQTLQQLLTRIAKQVDMRWELDGPNLTVMPDTPFLRTYRVDYVNMSRDSSGTVSVSTQIGSTSGSASTGAASQSASGGNASVTKVENVAKNHFWESLDKNIKDILQETDKIHWERKCSNERSSDATQGSASAASSNGAGSAGSGVSGAVGSGNQSIQGNSRANTSVQETNESSCGQFKEAASVISNPETGVIAIRASARQHEKIQEFLDQVMASAKRQVMIEMTIAEVQLSDQYQQGINWQSLRTARSGSNTAGFSLGQAQRSDGTTGGLLNAPAQSDGKSFVLDYIAPGLGISATISLLETFGNVRVLSSPKLSVLNNQTALLKVVNNIVYFEVKADTTTNNNGPSQTTFTTTPKSVSVGLVMSITPQISESGNVLLNVRPSISRQKGSGKRDPNPNIPASIPNIVPEIETREMESILRLSNGEIAVMGGLMQDAIDNTTNAVPGVSEVPILGNLFKQRNDNRTKTELVIFLRPIIVREPSMSGDYREFRPSLPTKDFFGTTAKSIGSLP